MKPMILTMFAALSLMAAQNTSTPASQAPAKGSSSAPAATAPATPAPADKKVVKHHKKNTNPSSTSTDSGKPATGDSSKPAAPVSK